MYKLIKLNLVLFHLERRLSTFLGQITLSSALSHRNVFALLSCQITLFQRLCTEERNSGWLKLIALISALLHSKRYFCVPKTCSFVCSPIWIFEPYLTKNVFAFGCWITLCSAVTHRKRSFRFSADYLCCFKLCRSLDHFNELNQLSQLVHFVHLKHSSSFET